MNIVSFIFARGDSREIKRKNLLKFKKTTLLGNSILQSKKSRYIKRIFVSTDSNKIAREAKKNNILNKPFKFNKPIILIHGLKDDVVSHKMPQKIMNNTTSKNVQVHYLKSSDHRLSSEEDLRSITKAIDTIRILI